MAEKENPFQNAELSMEQNYNSIDGIINNLPLALPTSEPVAAEPPLDKVKEQTAPKRRRSLER